jgi:FkbH-like protein
MRLIEALSLLQRVNPADPCFPVALICGFTPQPLGNFLAAHLQSRLPGRRVEVRGGLFGDLVGNLERYVREPCGPAAVVLEWADLDSRLGWRRHGGWGRARVAEICAVVEEQLQIIQGLLSGAWAGAVTVALPSIPAAPVEPTPGWLYGELQSRLDATAASFASRLSAAHVRLVNPARLAALSPLHQRLDVKTSNQAGFPYHLAHADALASLLAQLLYAPAPLKGIITDLDETLWAGILGEVGVSGVAWDLDHHAAHHGVFQQMLQSLADSGVLVAVASKNDPMLVHSALERPDMLLRADSIFPVEAHWKPKSESVAQILRAWNVSADSVLFIDDSAMELAEVHNAHVDLKCRQFVGSDPNQIAALITELADLFGKPLDSAEDSLRLTSLRAGAERQSEIDGTESLEKVLSGAGGLLKISLVGDRPDPRALELVNKTNQFNLNGGRINEAEWLQCVRAPGHIVWIAAYEDRFGPLGKISVLVGRFKEKGVLELDTWVLSCRAFGRRIEYALLAALFQQYSLHQIHFRFEATARNGPLQEFLSSLIEMAPGSRAILDFTDFEQRKLSWYLDFRLPNEQPS